MHQLLVCRLIRSHLLRVFLEHFEPVLPVPILDDLCSLIGCHFLSEDEIVVVILTTSSLSLFNLMRLAFDLFVDFEHGSPLHFRRGDNLWLETFPSGDGVLSESLPNGAGGAARVIDSGIGTLSFPEGRRLPSFEFHNLNFVFSCEFFRERRVFFLLNVCHFLHSDLIRCIVERIVQMDSVVYFSASAAFVLPHNLYLKQSVLKIDHCLPLT